MFSQYFGQFLLNNKVITPEQLLEGLRYQKNVRLKLGVLALNAGYLKPTEIEIIHEAQKKADKKFGEIAVEKGFLTSMQVEELLAQQNKGHLLLAQYLVDKNYLSIEQLQQTLKQYKEENGLTDQAFTAIQGGDINEIIRAFVALEPSARETIYHDYIGVFFRNVIRFLDSETMLENSKSVISFKASRFACQEIEGPFKLFTAIAADERSCLEIAGRYARETFKEFDELAQASLGEFLNLVNGIFLVNMSNRDTELEMRPQRVYSGGKITFSGRGYVIPFRLREYVFYLLVGESAVIQNK